MTREVSWKNYVATGVQAGLAVAIAHSLAVLTKCPVSDHWATIGTAGAIGSVVGAYETQTGGLSARVKGLLGRK